MMGIRASGRTSPIDVGCECADGSQVEAVVKLKGKLHEGVLGLAIEAIGNLLANALGIRVPEPLVIEISADFAAIASKKPGAGDLAKSIGKNFGTVNLGSSYMTWPTDGPLLNDIFEQGCMILALDALLQNPDRREEKPNVLWKGESLFAIDFEMSFSNRFIIGPKVAPWEKAAFEKLVKDHLFFSEMRGRAVRFGEMPARLNALKKTDILGFIDEFPTEWKTPGLNDIIEHLTNVISNSKKFFDNLKVVLS